MTAKTDTIILIHGLWMRGLVLLAQQHWLRAEGFGVRRFSYPSWRGGLADNVRLLSHFVDSTPGTSIHLVAHSLGGLVVLKMLSQKSDPRIQRIIVLGTPFAGCHGGASLASIPLLNALVGHTLEDWSSQSRPSLPPTVEIGVIAGTRSFGIGRLIPGLPWPNDGVVAVDETHIAEARDSIAMEVSHSGMLVCRACAGQITHFLRNGCFVHA